ncbi:MAG TPA: hypothetical protein DD417_07455, partial [Elusimicrobia bacterium]|nr:hypothetical protein [Elusimicrobiota bacterium]
MRKGALLLVFAAAALGAALAGHSSFRHLQLSRHGAAEQSYCSLSEKIDCDVVNASSYSEFLGVPIAWWGLLFYLLVGAAAGYGWARGEAARPALAAAWLASLGSLGYCAFLAWVAVHILGVLCLECLGMYAVSVTSALALPFGMGLRPRELPDFIADYARASLGRPSPLDFDPRPLRQALIAGAVFLAGWGVMEGIQGFAGPRKRGGSVAQRVAAFYAGPAADIAIDPAWPVWGNPEARIVLVEFSDFQCVFCRQAAFRLKPFLQEFKGDIRYHFANYPMDRACNPALQRSLHPQACFAAKAGICAARKGAFWDFHDELFREQGRLSMGWILSRSEARGWDRKDFLACIEAPETAARLRADIKLGYGLRIPGTPTVFLNGRALIPLRPI